VRTRNGPLASFANCRLNMKYKHETWTIRKLCGLIRRKKMNLSPPYQRNDIWTTKAQQKLIETINEGWPLPNFFVLKSEDLFEMVDGQQRSRAVLAHVKGDALKDPEAKIAAKAFLDYKLNVTVISDVNRARESIEEYYSLVNSSGLHLNRPELRKAEYFDTAFLALVQSLARHPTFNALDLFSESSVNRMNDVDLVAELLTGLQCGIADKKIKMEDLFKDDIDQPTAKRLRERFERILAICDALNQEVPLKNTRYKQRNDFYSLFLLFDSLPDDDISVPKYFYRILRRLGCYISPSQEHCETLKEYAICCVTQSNGKAARDARHNILKELLMNEGAQANARQVDVLAMFGLPSSATIKIGRYLTLDAEQLERVEPELQ